MPVYDELNLVTEAGDDGAADDGPGAAFLFFLILRSPTMNVMRMGNLINSTSIWLPCSRMRLK